MDGPTLRVLVVDDRAVPAEQLRRDLAARPAVAGVRVARSAEQAAAALAEGWPTVAVVDVGVRGGTAAVAGHVPTVVTCNADRAELSVGLYAIEGGAVDLWVRGPSVDGLVRLLAAAATANPARPDLRAAGPGPTGSAGDGVVAVVGGVGGTVSLGTVIASLPADTAGVIATALPAAAVPVWADRVARRAVVAVAVAKDGAPLASGRLWVAPGDRHVTVRPAGDGWALAVRDGPAVHGVKPSFDLLLSSLATADVSVAAAVLGGCGTDGLAGLAAVRRAGGRTVAEDPATAACGGLPAAALACNAAEAGAPAERLAATLVGHVTDRRTRRAA